MRPERLYVKAKGSKEPPHVLKPEDKLKFTLSFPRGESSWELTFDELLPFVGVQHAIFEVKEGL